MAAGTLTEAGWADVAADKVAADAIVEHDAIADPGQPAFLGVPEERVDEANALLDAHLAPYRREDGRYELPVNFLVVSARAPGSRRP